MGKEALPTVAKMAACPLTVPMLIFLTLLHSSVSYSPIIPGKQKPFELTYDCSIRLCPIPLLAVAQTRVCVQRNTSTSFSFKAQSITCRVP
jgi:hypothetical protein